MEARLAPLYEMFKINSRLYLNCLEGMDENQAAWRPSDQTNSAGYIALHLVDSRYLMAKMIGMGNENPFAGRAKQARESGMSNLPSLDELRGAWKGITGELRVKFGAMTDQDLRMDTGSQLPVDDKSVLGILSFLLQHDSYHIGQLGLLRKQAGLTAMSYR